MLGKLTAVCERCATADGEHGPHGSSVTLYQNAPGKWLCSGCMGGDSVAHEIDVKPLKGPCDTFAPAQGSARRADHCEGCGWTEAFHSVAAEPAPILDAAIEESQARKVIRDRCADWSRRSDKWHGILDTARRRVADGDKAPAVIGAIVALLAWRFQTYAGALSLAGAFLCALVGWRARIGRGDLDDSHTEQCWLIADRMSEFYRGLIAQFGSVPDQLLLSKSQIVESEARIGLPDKVRDAIACVVKVS